MQITVRLSAAQNTREDDGVLETKNPQELFGGGSFTIIDRFKGSYTRPQFLYRESQGRPLWS